jgi:hypothetical protein
MIPEEYELHGFLLDANFELHHAAKQLPHIRDYIDGLAETAGTFKLGNIEDVYQPNFTDEHIEFCHAWPVHDIYAPEAERLYVNPNYVHAHTYTDLIVRCECGAHFSRNYEDDFNSLRNEHDHEDHCLPHWRLAARARMTEQRWRMMNRLTRIGWRGSDMAARLGARTRDMGPYADQFNTTVGELYQSYRRITGNTYRYLVHYVDIDAQTVSDIYNHAPTTMTKWATEHAEVPLPSGGGDG